MSYRTGEDPIQRHRIGNGLQTLALLAGIGLLVMGTAAAFGGSDGMVIAGLAVSGLLLFSKGMPPGLVMRFHGGRPISTYGFGELPGMVVELSRRAGLDRPPAVFLIPSRSPNAFTAGRNGNSAIGLTEELIRGLNARELYGVLAHEIGHIRNGDAGVMTLSDVLSRVTHGMSLIGQLLLLLNLPLVLLSKARISWTAILVLLLAPTVVDLLRLALSRSREFDAALEAARLTGDPEGLAHGLARMDQQTRYTERMLLQAGIRIPSFLRTHPSTTERTRRLLSLARELGHGREDHGFTPTALPRRFVSGFMRPTARPHEHEHLFLH